MSGCGDGGGAGDSGGEADDNGSDTDTDTDSDSDMDMDADTDTDTDTDADTDTDTDTDTDVGPAPDELPSEKLKPKHTGWMSKTSCWGVDCHSKTSTHNPDMKPHQCTACHGTNGAVVPLISHGRVGCAVCHPDIHSPERDYPVPISCNTCHY